MKVSNINLAVMIPLTFPFVPAGFFYSFAQMERPDFTFIHADNGPIDTLRNDLAEKALQMGCTHGIFMDTDMCYHPKTIPRLLSHRLPVVGALSYRRYPPFDPIMLRGKPGEYYGVDQWVEGELVEVDATGAGCMLFEMNVFRKMPPPWFKFRKLNGGDETIGEDIGFCCDLKAAGYRIFVDTAVPSAHMTHMAVNHQTYLLYRSMKIKQHKAALEVALQGEAANI